MTNRKRGSGAKEIQFFGPLLDALRSLGGSGTPSEVAQEIAQKLKISHETQKELLASGQPRYQNLVHWARYYLAREGLLDMSKRGVWSLSERGLTTSLTPEESREIYLKRVKIDQGSRIVKDGRPETLTKKVEEHIHSNPEVYRDQLIETILKLPPSGFERLSQHLLREAGFAQVVVTGSSDDGGIDGYGTLEINPFVSFKVVFQCKRYRKAVSSPDVRNFRGAMAGRADKGIIITTGTFTDNAKCEASRDGVPPIELIDGEKLIKMMMDLELGLKPVTTYEVDDSFFNVFRT